ncbi:hypothetical protein DICSQDRAFT_183922 [Dichomitus squalens LYAD-421 SS1]|uniref:F-box domain-containing protein n=1 Tax=Dichomitus squalens (strain LYAD-421) TaxID=732165 RepID=R7SJC5_DICSQ|nr:uncharacterized protein DICSQDRAFT_183922 [Dichomitus squalens LYAD-421 SS1]EJF56234.1 hypothetical protein DICSQDRAFT_183922 [Dichomitus squalens LYAD-421 SS1]
MLRVWWADFGDDHRDFHEVAPQLPALRSFTVDCTDGLPRMACLLQAFPALDDTLSFNQAEVASWWPLDDRLNLVRDENKRAQESHCWAGLDRVSCEARVFVILGLMCPIRHADVVDCSTLTRDSVATALRDNPPRRLTLSVELERGPSVLHGLFPSELEPTLTHLVVTLRCAEGDDRRGPPDFDFLARVQLDELLDMFLHSIARLCPRWIRLSFYSHSDSRAEF